MRQANSFWKIALAIVSILISLLVWKQGLEESFDRPSVVPALSINQQEMSILAKPAIPSSLRTTLVGSEPENALRESLGAIPLDEMEDRQRLVLAALENSLEKKKILLNFSLQDKNFESVQKALIESSYVKDNFDQNYIGLSFNSDPLLKHVVCFAIGGDGDNCIDSEVANNMAMRLVLSQLLPVIALIVGSGFLIRHIWMFVRGSLSSWPVMTAIPLSITDMILLVGGGFVVLGEVISPALLLPFTSSITSQFSSPLNESVRVLVGYCSMTLPPLFILRRQLNSLDQSLRPEDGWLNWRLKPLNSAAVKAVMAWLMVLPPVLITGWFVSSFFGDQGGSNPLLELVLDSRDPVALGLLVITTVVLAPLFEELVFRGVLLPVLVKEIGKAWAVVASAFVFAMAHLSVIEFPPLLVLGIGLALLRISSGRLLPCVLMHALWNGMTFVNLLLLAG